VKIFTYTFLRIRQKVTYTWNQ